MTTAGHSMSQTERPFYEQEELNAALKYSKPDKNGFNRPQICRSGVRKYLASMFPVFTWLARYDLGRDLVGDLIAGGTVAVMHIPQGMGYALLANVPPILGIYTAFFPVLVYFVFGTSRHNSMGTFAVVSIMIGKSVLSLTQTATMAVATTNSTTAPFPSIGGGTFTDVDGTIAVDMVNTITPIEVATTITFFVGMLQLLMYVFRMGIVSTLLSESLVSGFTTGAAIQVLTSQVKDLLGIKLPAGLSGNFQVIYVYIEIFRQLIGQTFNWAAVVASVITIVILVLNNDFVKPALAKKCSVPIPIELIAVVGGTLAGRYFDLSAVYGLRTIGNIPTGFPAVEMPRFDLFPDIIVNSVMVTMVSYTVSVSMALIFAQRMNYEIDFNQELLALGGANVIGSFFTCLPVAASLSRSNIQHGVGGRTQVTSLVSCSILVVVLLWIGPFFEELPRCVLASVIVVSLKSMLLQVKQFFHFWHLSRLDAVVWLVTFLTVCLVALDVGLAVGVALSLASIFIRGMKPYVCLLGNVPHTDFYVDVQRYKAAEELPMVKIFHYCGSLNFASRDSFKALLCDRIGLDLRREVRKRNAPPKQEANGCVKPGASLQLIKCLIIDFSALSYIDPSGCSSLKLLVQELNRIDICVFIAGAPCPSYELMKKCQLLETANGSFKFYPTVHDAVHRAFEVVTPISVISGGESP